MSVILATDRSIDRSNARRDYTTLILDRTHKGQPPRAVYADSLPGYQENACYILRDVLQFCPELGTDNAEWIEAQVPRQGMGSNDCGLFAATFAALYVEALKRERLVGDNPVVPEKPITGVTLQLPPKMTATKFGKLARQMIYKSTEDAQLQLNSRVFQARVNFTRS